MNSRIQINTQAQQLFFKLGCGMVEFIEIYKEEGSKLFFKAGSGKFHILKEELASYQ